MRKPSVKVSDIFETNNSGICEVIAYTNRHNVTVRFADTGYETTVQAGDLRKGQVKDPLVPSVYGVGFLGVGTHKSNHRNESGKWVKTPAYKLWQAMLQRCYDTKFHKRYPTYQGCAVDTRWHNYQNFCSDLPSLVGYQEWADYHSGTNPTQYQLDKDTLLEGNRVYSRYTSQFITATENKQEANHRKAKKNTDQ